MKLAAVEDIVCRLGRLEVKVRGNSEAAVTQLSLVRALELLEGQDVLLAELTELVDVLALLNGAGEAGVGLIVLKVVAERGALHVEALDLIDSADGVLGGNLAALTFQLVVDRYAEGGVPARR